MPTLIQAVISGGLAVVGERVESGSAHNSLALNNALTVDYDATGTPRLSMNLAPLGFVNAKASVKTEIPFGNIVYTLELDEADGHEVCRLYRDFFAKAAEASPGA